VRPLKRFVVEVAALISRNGCRICSLDIIRSTRRIFSGFHTAPKCCLLEKIVTLLLDIADCAIVISRFANHAKVFLIQISTAYSDRVRRSKESLYIGYKVAQVVCKVEGSEY
jgi:hypothetical protein